MKNYKWLIIAIIASIPLLVFYYNHRTEQHKPKIIENFQDHKPQDIRKDLKVSTKDSNAIYRGIQTAQSKGPSYTFYEEGDVYQASKSLETKINNQDATLPKEVVKKSDRTVISPNTKDPENTKVDVYKIDLEKHNRVYAGVTQIGSATRATVGYGRDNYTVLVHSKPINENLSNVTKIDGVTALYTWRF